MQKEKGLKRPRDLSSEVNDKKKPESENNGGCWGEISIVMTMTVEMETAWKERNWKDKQTDKGIDEQTGD